MPSPLPALIGRARLAMTLNQAELADLAESSKRTVQRWEVGQSNPAAWHIQRIADAVRSHDPALAEELDAWAPRPAAAPLPVPEPAQPPPPPAVLVDAVVCAAAEAMGVAPQSMRPALAAAFARARELGLSPDVILAVLSPLGRANTKVAKRSK